jgi:hypothetical protein
LEGGEERGALEDVLKGLEVGGDVGGGEENVKMIFGVWDWLTVPLPNR